MALEIESAMEPSVSQCNSKTLTQEQKFEWVYTNFVGRKEFKLLPCSQVNSTWHTSLFTSFLHSQIQKNIDKAKRETSSPRHEPQLICVFPQIILLRWSSRGIKAQFVVRLPLLMLSVISVQCFVRTASGSKCLHMSNFTLDQQCQWIRRDYSRE